MPPQWASGVSRHADRVQELKSEFNFAELCLYFGLSVDPWKKWNKGPKGLVGYLIFVGALVFEFVAPPLDQILTTPEQLCKVPWGTY